MTEDHTLMLSLTTYKIVSILAGLAFAFMGYRLFIHGIFTEAGELSTNWENRSLVLKKAAPGTFFALFGTIILCITLWRGLTLGPDLGGGFEGSGMFNNDTSKGEDRSRKTSNIEVQAVLNDIVIFNEFVSDLLRQREQGVTSNLTMVVEDSGRILDLIDRTKTTMMLSVWSPDWGDPEEFKKWAGHAPGYFYSDPPTNITRAAAIFKGEGQ